MTQRSGVDIPIRVDDQTTPGLRSVARTLQTSIRQMQTQVAKSAGGGYSLSHPLDAFAGSAPGQSRFGRNVQAFANAGRPREMARAAAMDSVGPMVGTTLGGGQIGGLAGAARDMEMIGKVSTLLRGGALFAGITVGVEQMGNLVGRANELSETSSGIRRTWAEYLGGLSEAVPLMGRVTAAGRGLFDALHEFVTQDEARARMARQQATEIGRQNEAQEALRQSARGILDAQAERLRQMERAQDLAIALVDVEGEEAERVRERFALEDQQHAARVRHAEELAAFDEARAELMRSIESSTGLNSTERDDALRGAQRQTTEERARLVAGQQAEIEGLGRSTRLGQQGRVMQAQRDAIRAQQEEDRQAQADALRQEQDLAQERMSLERDVMDLRRSMQETLLTDEHRERLRFEEQLIELERRGASAEQIEDLRSVFARSRRRESIDEGPTTIQRVQAESLGRFQRDRGSLEDREVAPERTAKAAERTAKATEESETLLREQIDLLRNLNLGSVQVVTF